MTTARTYTAEQLAQARQLGTSTLFEASGLATSSVDPAIRPIWAGVSVAGPAYPLECHPADNLSIHIAMERAPRGSILVVSTGGFIAGYWGEVLTVAAEAAGVTGLVIDGGVRDIAALTARRFPVFSRGVSMRGTIKVSAPSVGQPSNFTGTPVAVGDLVVADDDGVLVIPSAHVQATLAQGQSRFEKEAKMMEALTQGQSTLELMGLTQWRDKA
ncbi:RraA family protein [Pectobacterium odoriferum]|uniref:RraA family protein n=1 Tax=Pectobacterium odoriferum TaxID=78398 RepID=UPI00052AA26E|nr:dimethylmenaquinone methyltransferase [Pectobacterium odoriferum]AIU87539.1 dimethylmenaquinone methyltransferase [Pectobacterium odoriferum]POE17587.1 dimethylmenaquinone methyltransferase [Pectobacterium odoriferum]POE35054.1 dimethylmenaquinone methyltransferase [Pectobacterium odoriferum]